MNPLYLSSDICCLKDGILKVCKDPWIYVCKSHFLGWSWHLFFRHLSTLSQGDVQVWDLSKWENSSQARSAAKIRGAGMEELDVVTRLVPGMGSSETCVSYLHVSLCWQ